ncbi:uncharacterized protein LOC135694521 isoform X1 [Rhopilema esculentum]|uniref:uncharacterized protein LOC135694521 isoform X1 n=1 Tax=Rhopilema esculentum TaxID=499914 RepID=UPI0031D5F59A
MDPNLEQYKPLAREITRRLLEAWRLKRGYKYRSEKRVTHRKLYLALMKELMHTIGHRNLTEVIQEKVSHFNQNYQTSLSMEEFGDLLSSNYVPPPLGSDPFAGEDGNEDDLFEMGRDEVMDSVEGDKPPDVKDDATHTEVTWLHRLHGYTSNDEESIGSPKDVISQDQLSQLKAISAEESALKIERAVSSEEVTVMDTSDTEIIKSDIRSMFSENEKLRAELEPMLVYRDDPDMHDRIIAAELRGKKFKVSNDGRCPKCSCKKNVFVILDFLFPMGDMPDICNYLIAKGQAVLWSSQDDSHCKDPPTLLCRGKCPADPALCGFNLNWNRTDLESIFFFPDDEEDSKPAAKESAEQSKVCSKDSEIDCQVNTQEESETLSQETGVAAQPDGEDIDDTLKFDEGQVDMVHYKRDVSWVVLDEFTEPNGEADEEEDVLIKTMLALSKAKEDWKQGVAKLWPEESEDEDGDQIKENQGTDKADSAPDKASKQAFAFSWSSYGSNPWAPVDFDKKKSQISASKFLMIATGKAHVPKLLSKDASEDKNVEQETETVSNSASQSESKAVDDVSVTPKETPAVSEALPQSSSSGESAVEKTGSKSETEKKTYTADDYPVSKDGRCPYCESQEVVYIIINEGEEDGKDELPDILQQLLQYNFAYKMPKDENEPPSFQCLKCTYGFNLDWRSTDLEKIFSKKLQGAKNTAVTGNGSSDVSTTHNYQPESTGDYQNYGYPMHSAAAMSAPYQNYYAASMMNAPFYAGMGFPPMPFAPGYYAPHPGYFPPMGYHGYMPYPMETMPHMAPESFRHNVRRGSPFRLNRKVNTSIRNPTMPQKAQPAKEAAAKVSVEKESVAKVEKEKEGSKQDLSAKTEDDAGENTEKVESTEAAQHSEMEEDKTAADKTDQNAPSENKAIDIENSSTSEPTTITLSDLETSTVLLDKSEKPKQAVGSDTVTKEDEAKCLPELSTEPSPPGVNESTTSKPDGHMVLPGEEDSETEKLSLNITINKQEVVHTDDTSADLVIAPEKSSTLDGGGGTTTVVPKRVNEDDELETVKTKLPKLDDDAVGDVTPISEESEKIETKGKKGTKGRGRGRGRGRSRGRGKSAKSK